MASELDRKIDTLGSLIQSEAFQKQLRAALPALLTPERAARVFLTALRKKPKLATCNQESLFAALMDASQMGLEIDSGLHQATLVPYGSEAQLQVEYRGMCDMAYRTGRVLDISAACVYRNDLWIHERGTSPKITHQEADGDRGEMRGAYCVVHLVGGGTLSDYMNYKELMAIRDKSKAYSSWVREKRGDPPPWVTSESEMCKKTVVRRTLKLAPAGVIPREVMDHMDREDEREYGSFKNAYDTTARRVDSDPLAPGRHDPKAAATATDAVPADADMQADAEYQREQAAIREERAKK